MSDKVSRYTPLMERLLAKTVKTDTCWIWGGNKDAQGYGFIKRNGRTIRAHRASYELFVGPIPEGLTLDHLCRNPPCCNPEHLYAGTHQDNMRDRRERGKRRLG